MVMKKVHVLERRKLIYETSREPNWLWRSPYRLPRFLRDTRLHDMLQYILAISPKAMLWVHGIRLRRAFPYGIAPGISNSVTVCIALGLQKKFTVMAKGVCEQQHICNSGYLSIILGSLSLSCVVYLLRENPWRCAKRSIPHSLSDIYVDNRSSEPRNRDREQSVEDRTACSAKPAYSKHPEIWLN